MDFFSYISKPFRLICLSTQFLLRTVFSALHTGVDFFTTVAFIHLVLLWRITIFPIGLLSLPIRAFAALHREQMIEMQAQKMKKALENALWDRKELKEQLENTVKERMALKMMLTELEDEHGEAILQIELLVSQVEELKDEIRRLKEVQGNNKSIGNNDRITTPSIYKSAKSIQGYFDNEGSQLNTANINSAQGVLARERAVALSRSLFSATLSLVVGIVVWEAGDPCVPLVMALVAVVSMSLMSVVRFFSTFENKPARDAVALLSLNWFLLGTLAYPTFPRVVHVLSWHSQDCSS